MQEKYDLIILGGGPAGIFAAITYKTKNPNATILVIERSSTLLSKILLSGGGRCNLTHATFDPKSLVQNYPRGQKELLSAFYRFQPKDIMNFFEERNIKLKVEKDGRVFPASNKAKTIKDALLLELEKSDVKIEVSTSILSIEKNSSFTLISENKNYQCSRLLLASGSNEQGLDFASKLGHSITPLLPSLFAFNISPSLENFSGISLNASLRIKGSNFIETGPLLITHFGLSGPLILKLSSLATKYLHEKKSVMLEINWLMLSKQEALLKLLELKKISQKTLFSENPFKLPSNLWLKFLSGPFTKKLTHISNKDLETLAQNLTHDEFLYLGKTQNKNEFVTCGGVSLKEIDFKTMESKICPHLYFAGEILDIDGLTGGYNFQNAWTTGFIAGSA